MEFDRPCQSGRKLRLEITVTKSSKEGLADLQQVFVYGTLKRGFPNYHAIAEHVSFVGRFRTIEAYPLVVGGRWFSPNLINEPSQGHRVLGEVFETNAQGLEFLDQLEGTHHPRGYRRISVVVEELYSGARIDVWTYFKNRKDLDDICSEPMGEYQLDPQYVIPSQRDAVF